MQKENVFFFSFSSESNFSKGESYKFYFTSAIRLHTSDIFQPYFVCKVTNYISHQPSDLIHPTSFSHISLAKLINYFEMITRTVPMILKHLVNPPKKKAPKSTKDESFFTFSFFIRRIFIYLHRVS